MYFLIEMQQNTAFLCIYTFFFVYSKAVFPSETRLFPHLYACSYVQTRQNKQTVIDNYSQIVKTHKYSQKGVDNV